MNERALLDTSTVIALFQEERTFTVSSFDRRRHVELRVGYFLRSAARRWARFCGAAAGADAAASVF